MSLPAHLPDQETRPHFKFSELSEAAKQRVFARHEFDHEWWDCVYEDIVRSGEILGIKFDYTKKDPQIYFRLSYTQGDGSSFSGRWNFKPGCVEEIKKYAPTDETLHAIAERLTTAHITARLASATVRTDIAARRDTGISVCTTVEFENADEGADLTEPQERLMSDLHDELEEVFGGFNSWIYKSLRQQYEYLTSEEAIAEMHADDLFDEDGDLL